MALKSQPQIDRWKRVRSNGQKVFILRYGAIIGLVSASIQIAYDTLFKHEPIDLFLLVLAFSIFFLGGLGLAAWIWDNNESDYAKTINRPSA